jgi:hypothetical protein
MTPGKMTHPSPCANRSTTNPTSFFQQPRRPSRAFTLPPFLPAAITLHSALLTPYSCTLHSRLSFRPLPSAALHPSFHRSSPLALPPFTNSPSPCRSSSFTAPLITFHCAALHSAARTTSACRAPARATEREQLRQIFPHRAAVAIREAANPSTDGRTGTRDHLFVEQNSYGPPSHSVTYVKLLLGHRPMEQPLPSATAPNNRS